MSFRCNQSLETVRAFLIIFGVFKNILNILPTNNVLRKTSDQRPDLHELPSSYHCFHSISTPIYFSRVVALLQVLRILDYTEIES